MLATERETAVRVTWLERVPAIDTGVTWGVPWQEGRLGREDTFVLADGEGRQLPVQSWPTAYWPDGSVKWSAHAAVCPAEADAEWLLVKNGAERTKANKSAGGAQLTEPMAPAAPTAAVAVTVTESDRAVIVDTGAIVCTLNKQGAELIASVVRGGAQVCAGVRLQAIRQRTVADQGVRTTTDISCESRIDRVTVEQKGPVRAVVRIDGSHAASDTGASWLPFSLRLYFYAGQHGVRTTHTFFYDGNPEQEQIAGLGVRFDIPLSGPLYNRHVRLAGDSGFFAESPKSLHTRRTQGRYRDLHELQLQGERITLDAEQDARFLFLLDDAAVWESFKLVQSASSQYSITKRTKQECSWVKAAVGRRSGGLAYAGGENGGVAVGVRHFWEKYPASLEVSRMAGDCGQLEVWLWSPDAPAMDLRHYDTETHVESSYEGAEELRATPYGIANTNEWTMWFTGQTPDEAQLDDMVQESRSPALLVCEPEHYYKTKAFGLWSLPDRSTPAKSMLEDRMDGIIQFYLEEVELRDWYGFWDYGDMMHSYDPVRHVWNYDLGGCAWQNTELAANMWLWMMFLRSGRADIFRLAEAMTRHTSEVDAYHFGEYAGLGSRHNVVHWGCGCKEARIAMAGLHRYYYYLTADERIGDMMDEVKDADYATVRLRPMRAYFPKDEHPTHVRVGPDWAAFSSNWMTRWERYEDTACRDKLLTGLDSIKRANFRLLSGPTYGYDPDTGVLTPMGDDNWGRHLAICMGGPQVWFELAMMLKDPEWEEMLAEFGVFYHMSPEEKERASGGAIRAKSFGHPVLGAGIAAYGAYYTGNRKSARTTWDILLSNPYARVDLQREATRQTHVADVREIDWINTNEAAQWSLNTILALELIGDGLSEAMAEAGIERSDPER